MIINVNHISYEVITDQGYIDCLWVFIFLTSIVCMQL